MNLEVLMSAMYQNDFTIAYNSKVDSDLLIINQCNEDSYKEIQVKGHKWRMISTTERGLSRSREMAIQNAKGDICLFADDDELFKDNYATIIIKAYEELLDAGSIVFNYERIGETAKHPFYKIKRIRKAPWYRGYASCMLTFKRNLVVENNIHMNFFFGSGTPWGGGEEILLEKDIRKAGIPIYEHPATIVSINCQQESQWFNGFDEKFFFNQGAFIYFSNKDNLPLKFLWRLYTCYKYRRDTKVGVWGTYKWLCRGERGIKLNTPYEQYIKFYNG